MNVALKSLATCIVAAILLFSAQTLLAQEGGQSTNDTVAKFEEALKTAVEQYKILANNTTEGEFPRSVRDNEVRFVKSRDWTSGFFPGSLWYLYEFTGEEFFKTKAGALNAYIEQQKNNTGTHDLGFMLYCSFGNGDRVFDVQKYKDILVTASNSLISRYNSNVGCIRSWDFGSWEFPVIIDNMMNLEMLFWASKYTGDTKYYDIAVKHAQTTLKNHFREDFSSFHVVDYKKSTGAVISKGTYQGAGDSTAWARGQSWGLYGYTMAYRETKDEAFLLMAEKIGDFIISQLPEDFVPYWDFSKTGVAGEPRDASAGAIAASALIELAQYSEENSEKYLKIAEKILLTLCSDEYLAKVGANFNFILKHSTGSKPGGSEIDVPINYADYYFIEALLRYMNLKKATGDDDSAQDDGNPNDEGSGDNTDDGAGNNGDTGTSDGTGDNPDDGTSDEGTVDEGGNETDDETDLTTGVIIDNSPGASLLSYKISGSTLYLSEIAAESFIQIIDLNGHLLTSGNKGNKMVNLSSLTFGTYILRVVESEDIKTLKFVYNP